MVSSPARQRMVYKAKVRLRDHELDIRIFLALIYSWDFFPRKTQRSEVDLYVIVGDIECLYNAHKNCDVSQPKSYIYAAEVFSACVVRKF